ncbi:hypothetical protein cyc_02715 [Cyclospora cayetanensis]|uniref:Uncharacterized protein n=1 Tax=Cyclospora cayetanensis TaxID=88456 RepID=A0A1D3CVP5_9EIME|nr:hypothetical protein cyc_02715 [Cyclospora cayetanensis]
MSHTNPEQKNYRVLTRTKDGTPRDTQPEDWWIIGTTNYVVVDPTKPRSSTELMKLPYSPRQQQPAPLAVKGVVRVVSFNSRSKVSMVPSQRKLSGESDMRNTVGGVLGDTYSEASQKASREGKPVDMIERAGSSSTSGGQPVGHLVASHGKQNSAKLLRHLSIGFPRVSQRTSVQLLRYTLSAKPYRKLPSFRDIVRQLQADTQHHRFSKDNSEVQDGSVGSIIEGNPIKASSTESIFRKLAKERLKRSITRLSTRMPTSLCGGPIFDPDTEVHLPGSPLVDIGRLAINAFRRLKQRAHLLHSQTFALQRAAEILQSTTVLAEPEAVQGHAGCLSITRLFDVDDSPSSQNLIGKENLEIHAAMTEGQRQKLEQEAVSAGQQRQQQVESFKRFHEHIRTACECQEMIGSTRSSEFRFALTSFETLMAEWRKPSPSAPLLTAVALACLLFAIAYECCAVGTNRMAAHTLYSLMARNGSGEVNEEFTVRDLRCVVLHSSMMEQLTLIEGTARKIIALVFAHSTSSSLPTAEQFGLPTALNAQLAPPPANSPSLTLDSDMPAVVAAAQQAISALHEAAGRRGDVLMLEHEAKLNRSNQMVSSSKMLLRRLSFTIVELRLYLIKLLALRLALSEAGCVETAWEGIENFDNQAADFLSRIESVS